MEGKTEVKTRGKKSTALARLSCYNSLHCHPQHEASSWILWRIGACYYTRGKSAISITFPSSKIQQDHKFKYTWISQSAQVCRNEEERERERQIYPPAFVAMHTHVNFTLSDPYIFNAELSNKRICTLLLISSIIMYMHTIFVNNNNRKV